jgi:hypothetical protein
MPAIRLRIYEKFRKRLGKIPYAHYHLVKNLLDIKEKSSKMG